MVRKAGGAAIFMLLIASQWSILVAFNTVKQASLKIINPRALNVVQPQSSIYIKDLEDVKLAKDIPSLRFIAPLNNSLLHDETIVIEIEVHHFEVPKDGGIRVQGEKVNGLYVYPNTKIYLQNVKTGTHIIKIYLENHDGEMVTKPEILYFESILLAEKLQVHRYPLAIMEREPIYYTALQSIEKQRKFPIKVCYVTSMLQFDGQKQIYLQNLKHLKKTDFEFQFISLEEDTNSSLKNVFEELNAPVLHVELMVTREDAQVHYLSQSNLMAKLLHKMQNCMDLNAISTNTSIDCIQPICLQKVLRALVNGFRTCEGGIVTLGNSCDIGDIVIAYAAKIAGVQSVVMELPNYDPVPNQVDAIIAPSHYMIHHPSVFKVINATSKYVITPGIDVNVFSPADGALDHVGLKDSNRIVIGFVGRHSVEKSIGLLLRSAQYVIRVLPNAKFHIIGDGKLTRQLKELARMWNISNNVVFIPGIYNTTALVNAMREFDVMASTSSQETFCLANIEAMAIGIPIIGFGDGGTTEYTRHNENCILIDAMDPILYANGIIDLLRNHTLRNRLGRNGRHFVMKRFRIDQTVAKYREIYARLGSRT